MLTGLWPMQRPSRMPPSVIAVSLVLASAVACTGDGASNSSSSRIYSIAEFTATVRAAAAAARPALAVPTTTILADATGVLAPMGSGATSVDDRGAAHQHVPIWTPPGRAGIQPELSLEYVSGAPNALVGVGWQLAGLSRITHCKGLRQWGNAGTPVVLSTTDSFCLDGEPIVDLGSDQIFYAKFHDDGSRIERVQGSSSEWVLRSRTAAS